MSSSRENLGEEHHSSSDDDDDESSAPDLVILPDDEPVGPPPPLLPTPELPKQLPPVPVTILTGFLGAGKTTLIRFILSSPDHGYRIAVIENEFGGDEAAGDANAILAERTGLNVESLIARDGLTGSSLSDLIELPNGCVCCTVKDSLVETLENLLEKRQDIDYIIIEASGMANPGPIASVFWLDEALESRLRLDGVVAIVDAVNIVMQLRETSCNSGGAAANNEEDKKDRISGEEAAQQIAYADRIILNKVDLLSTPLEKGNHERSIDCRRPNHTVECVVDEIRSINPTAPIHRTNYSKVPDLKWILDAKCFDAEKAKDVEETFAKAIAETGEHKSSTDKSSIDCTSENCDDPDHNHEYHHHHHHHHHTHTSSVGTTALIREGSVDLRKINLWLASLLWPDQDEDDAVLTARLKQLLEMEEEGKTNKDIENNAGQDVGATENKKYMQIFRIKGILSVWHKEHGSSLDLNGDIDDAEMIDSNGLDCRRHIVQGVNDLWEIHPGSEALRYAADEERICKLIFIGRSLDRSMLKQGFEGCFRQVKS